MGDIFCDFERRRLALGVQNHPSQSVTENSVSELALPGENDKMRLPLNTGKSELSTVMFRASSPNDGAK